MPQNDNKRYGRAGRRPSDTSERRRYSQNMQKTAKYTASRRPTQVSQSRGVSPIGYGRRTKDNERALIKREEKALVEARREREWQADVERVRGGVDKIMLVIIILLLAMGALMMYSASYPTALGESGDKLSN